MDNNDTGDNLVRNFDAGMLHRQQRQRCHRRVQPAVLDLAQAAPFTLGDKVTGTLEPYAERNAGGPFRCQRGRQLFFDANGATGDFTADYDLIRLAVG